MARVALLARMAGYRAACANSLQHSSHAHGGCTGGYGSWLRDRVVAQMQGRAGYVTGVSPVAAAAATPVRLFGPRGLAALALAVPAAGLPFVASYDNGLYRSLYFNVNAFPLLAHYRLLEWWTKEWSDKEQEEVFQPLHERYAPVALNVIRTLRGFYIKLGQIGATRSDFVAKQYIERMETLQDSCPFEPLSYVKEVVERSLDRPFDEVFESIDELPLGSASIGQVHRARLRDGREVAVKVQYPQVEQLFRGDMATIRTFCTVAQPEHLTVLDEVERAFLTEFDYLREAQALSDVSDNVARSPFRGRIAVPRPIMELCRKHVLVMEYLPGVKLVDGIRAQFASLVEQRGAAGAEAGSSHGGAADAIASGLKVPSAWKMRLFRGYLRTADAVHNFRMVVRNNTVGWVMGRQLPYRHTELPVNIAEVLHLLTRVHGWQIFFDGLFNGDCHPGNVLLCSDGRIGLIDYGQAKRLGVDDRKALAWLILALADGQRDEIVRRFRAMGYRTKLQRDEVAYTAAVIAFDRDDREITGGMNIQAYFEQQAREDPILRWPEEMVMASRNALLLRGMGIVLGVPLSMAKEWRSTAKAFLKQCGERSIH